jgi:hypothetical protein
MICSHCHTPNPTSADVCSRCGSGLDIAADIGATLEISDSASINTGTDFGPATTWNRSLARAAWAKSTKPVTAN